MRAALALLCVGCIGDIHGADGDGGVVGASVAIAEPSAGATFIRDQVAADGAFVAPIAFRAETTSDEVVTVDWLAEGTYPLGSGFSLVYEYRGDGERWVDAVARGAGGEELGRATVAFVVAPPPPTDCLGALVAAGVDFEEGPQNPGVETPVTVYFPLNGMVYRYSSADAPREAWMMDCELALALSRANAVFAAHDVVEVVDIGIYNYRCIDQSVDPPDCPGSSLSMHAYALAIDIAGVTTSNGSYHSVNDDWVIDPDSEDTCSAPTENAKDELLHSLVCALSETGVFQILLTPNYNAAHRNHFHVDLTPNGDFIERTVVGVDVGAERH